MAIALKPLAEQTIVITGASSGIGLATARRAARAGARVVLVARNEDAVREAAEGIILRGGKAAYIALDVADEDAPQRIGALADQRFGGFDTWVNNAAAAMYAELLDTSIEEHRRVFEVGYFALVRASLFAVPRLDERGGGALINIGSVLSERAISLQGAYSAAKHAVLGFTEALRTEVEAAGKPVSITLIKPAGIDTPYPEHARNKIGAPARIPPVVYDPELVAKAICFAAANRKRELTVGGVGLMISGLGNAMPRMTDLVIESFMGRTAQTIDQPAEVGAEDNLFEPRKDGRERSNQDIYVRRQSVTLEAQMRPLAAATVIAGLGAAAYLLTRKPQPPVFAVQATGAHQPDGTDSSASFAAGIADESTIPEAEPSVRTE
ncbi:SDR family oxidoreductase [Sphingomonas qomolangmaensis]|uniref:SDR family oxidoreductase n=1 Tax=Sphingomonas qomolangmaensis TaxID=2918765 RepID=A0ABY5LC86_9SPHN|nr:SDR family oxidoreductase [Sphingomonas qomolangmaensis]UUL83618.1 SDR family oxidoreductase [Sphingomonas qomolangmaensis]